MNKTLKGRDQPYLNRTLNKGSNPINYGICQTVFKTLDKWSMFGEVRGRRENLINKQYSEGKNLNSQNTDGGWEAGRNQAAHEVGTEND